MGAKSDKVFERGVFRTRAPILKRWPCGLPWWILWLVAILTIPFLLTSTVWAEGSSQKAMEVDGTYGLEEPKFPALGETFETNDPIFAGGGEFRQYWPLINLGGPMDLNFTLIYAPDLQFKSPFNDGRTQFPPGQTNDAFTTNTIFRMVEFEDRTTAGNPAYINVFLFDDAVVFRYEGTNLLPVGPVKYQMKKIGDYYYMMDPIVEWVYVFRSRAADWDMGTQYIRRFGEAVYIMDRNNNTLTFTYNTGNNPTRIEDGLGRRIDLTYNAPFLGGDLTRVADGYGRAINLSFQQMSCQTGTRDALSSLSDVTGQLTRFEYYAPTSNKCNLVKRIVRPLNNSHIDQAWTLNPHNVDAISSQKDAYGNEATLSFTEDSQENIITTVTNPDGTTRVFHHERERYPLDVTDETGKKFTMSYNADDQITSIKDRLDDTTSLAYHALSGKPASVTNTEGKAINYTYTAQNQTFTTPIVTVEFTFYNRTKTDYPGGTSEQFTYDTKGNRLTRIDGAGKTWTYTYNSRGQVLTITNPAGGVITYTYNADATLASSRDSDTGATTYGYNAYRRVNRITRPDGEFIQIAYNLNDQITSITDENSHTYSYEYDANGNLIRVTDPAGNQTQYAYDLMDRVNQVTNRLGKVSTLVYNNMGRLQSATDPTGIATNLGYDTRGWLNSMTLGGKTWQSGYDNEGIVSSTKTPLNYTTTYQSDKLGFVTGITNPLSQTTTLTRDDLSRITGITDPLNRSTTYAYDSRGLLSGVTLPVIGTATYTRNDQGLLSQITDLNGSQWAFGYTDAGRRQSDTDPLGNTWQYSYDTRGRPSITTFPGGGTITRTHDAAGNITRLLYSGGPDLQLTYDSLNRLLTANNLTLTRDVEGRVTNTENPGTAFGATYDDGGRLKTVAYNNGAFTVTHTYETTTGLLSRVTDSLTGAQIDFTYDNDRRMIGIARSNGVNTTLTWDNASGLTRIKDGPSTGSGFIDLQYTLNVAGEVTQAKMTVPLDPAGFLEQGTDSFTYDAASQVSTTGYTYDQRGRQTAMPGHTFAWDGASRLTGIGGAALGYNGLGDLITRTESGTTIHYYYNYAIGLKPIVAEKNDTTGQFLRYYIWTPGGSLLYMIDATDGNKVYFYHFDRTGNTLALTGSTGAVTDSYAYTPYGKLLGDNGTSVQPFTFVGQYGVRQEGESGTLYHMRARYYDANTARFISRDPVWPAISDPREINPYQYAKGEPISYIDPTGMWMQKAIKWALKQVVGEVIVPDYAELAESTNAKLFPVFFWYTVANPEEAAAYALGEHIAERAEAEQDRIWKQKLGPQREAREQERIRKQEEARMAEAWKDPEKEAAMLKAFADKFRNDKEKASLIKRAEERLNELAKARHQGNRETPLKILRNQVAEEDRPMPPKTILPETDQSAVLRAFLTGGFLNPDYLLALALTMESSK